MSSAGQVWLPVALAACSLLSLAQTAVGQDPDTDSSGPHVTTDPVELRRISNRRYINRPVHAKVTQRFEMYDPHSKQALQDLKDMGFTQVILDWPNLHEAATQAGLDVVLANWWTFDTSQEQMEAAIDRAQKVDSERLIGFSIMDEPGRNAPQTPFTYYSELYKGLLPTFREQFPNTKLEISHWGPMAGWSEEHYEYFAHLYRAADVMRIMPYPDLGEGPLDDVFFMMQRSRRLMEIAEVDLPMVVILQTWGLPPENKFPEMAELRVMAYQAMLSGAEAVSFFEYNLEVWNGIPNFQTEFRSLMEELSAFSRAHRSHDVTTTMDDEGILTAVITGPSGERRYLTINTRRTPTRGLDPLQVRVASGRTPENCKVVVSRPACRGRSACCESWRRRNCCSDGPRGSRLVPIQRDGCCRRGCR